MIDDKAREFIKGLLSTPGFPGYELPAQQVWRNYVRDYADKVYIDLYYNAVASLNEKGSPRIMLTSHIDQVGLMVSYIDDKGFIYLRSLGAVYPLSILSREVYIMTRKHGYITGVIGCPEDIYKRNESVKLSVNKLWVDIGAASVEEVKEKVTPGDCVVLKCDPVELGLHRIAGPGMDDRIGCFAIAQVLKELSGKEPGPAVFSVTAAQEEVTALGAKLKSEEVKPDISIIVDIELCTDYPTKDKIEGADIAMGKGPVINRGICNDRFISDRLIEVAEKNSIAYQIYPNNAPAGTDLLSVVKSGTLGCVLGIPTRYYHTSVEMADLEDVSNTVKLLVEFIHSFKEDLDRWTSYLKM